MPLCTIGHRFAKNNAADQLFVFPWRECLLHKHDWDAHAWPYVLFNDDVPATPVRVKSVAGRPVLAPGQWMGCWLAFLDFDKSNDHRAILEKFLGIPERHYLSKFSAVYPTKGGMRFVYELDSPVDTDQYGPLVRGMAAELAILTGLQVDESTDQWSRCMRLPSVTRNDEKGQGPTWEQPYWFDTIVQDAVLATREVRPRFDRLPWDTRGRAAMTEAPEATPDLDTELPDARKRAYKKAMRSSRFKDYIFVTDEGDRAPIGQGRRDQMLIAIAGDTVARCFVGVPEACAEEVFALLKPIALGFELDNNSETWEEKLWRLIRHCWNGEVKKQEDNSKKETADRSLREILQIEMMKYLPKETIPNDAGARDAFCQRHYCLQTKSGAYVVLPSGEYSHAPLRASQLPAHFGESLSHLAESAFLLENGTPMSGQEILNRHSVNIDDVIFEAGAKRLSRLSIQGDRRILHVVPFGLRQDLIDTAAFDPEVDAWLDSFKDAAILKRWLAAALALHEGPIAACYLHGPRAAGKSMLALAIAECFHGQPTPGAMAFSNFNGALLNSPVIMVDEGLPERKEGMSTADLFRSLVTGSAVSTQRKFEDASVTMIPYRILFAANSFDMASELFGRRSLGAQDREAFRERMLVVECGDGPTHYLNSRGAMSFTKDDPKGSWLGGACRLSRHLIWLYLQQAAIGFKRDGRMLVEGNQHPGFSMSFDLSGDGRTVVDDLVSSIGIAMNRKQAPPALLNCLRVEHDGCVWVKKRPFVKLKCLRSERHYSKALDRFLTGRSRLAPNDMITEFEVDVLKLSFCGASEGLAVSPLQVLAAQKVLA